MGRHGSVARDLSGADYVGAVLIVAWVVAALMAASLRPGELLEFALLGVAGLAAWPLVASAPSVRESLFAGLLLTVPLLNTWPARAYVADVAPSGIIATTILAPTTLVVVALVIAAPSRRPTRVCRLVLGGAGLVLLGTIVGTLASDAPRAAGAAALSAFVLPIAAGAVALASAVSRETAWRMLASLSIGAIVPAGMGLAAYLLSFGAPLSVDELLFAKAALYRPYALHEVTFGNVGHLAALALLLLPGAVAVAARRAFPPCVRLGGLAAAGLLAVDLVLVLSRAAFLALAIVAVALAVMSVLRSRRGAALLLAGGAGLAMALAVVAGVQPARSGAGADWSAPAAAAASAEFRREAARAGLRVARDNPLGIGTGQYVVADPVHGAPHSLVLLVLAENSAAAAAGLGLLFVAFLLAARRLARQETPADEWLLTSGAAAGLLGFTVFGVAAGAPLALGTLAIWSVGSAFLLGVALPRRDGSDA
jgi:hypothetical protein